MRNNKLCFILIIGLLLSCLFVGAQGAGSAQYYGEPISLGKPFSNVSTLDMTTGKFNGKYYYYTTAKGSPSIFSAVNLTDNVVETTCELIDISMPWAHQAVDSGYVYITGKGGTLNRYNQTNQSIENKGIIKAGESDGMTLCADENGNIFIGTYPNAGLVKYSPLNDEMTYLGRVDEEASYVMSVAYHNGFIYAVTKGTTAKLYKIPVNDFNAKTQIPIEGIPGYVETSEITSINTVSITDQLLCIYASGKSADPLIVYDTTSDTFIDVGFRKSMRSKFVSSCEDGKAFFISTDGKLQELNTVNKSVAEISLSIGQPMYNNNGCQVVLNGVKYVVTMRPLTGIPILINPIGKNQTYLGSLKLGSTFMSLRAFAGGENGNVYFGSFHNGQAGKFNTADGTITYLDSKDQCESILEYKNKVYFCTYPGAYLRVYDPETETTRELGQVAGNQDRVYAALAADDKIFMGSVPGYFQNGGALAWYDINTDQITTVNQVVPGHSIKGIAYRDGKIYGTTTIYGGTGSTAISSSAKIFEFDLATQNVRTNTPTMSGLNNPPYLEDIKFDKNGTLWCSGGGSLFSVNTTTLEMDRQLQFRSNWYLNVNRWIASPILFDHDGLLYVNIDGMKIVNVDDLTYQDLSDKVGNPLFYALDTNGNLFYASDTELYMLPRYDFEPSNKIQFYSNIFLTYGEYEVSGNIQTGIEVVAFAKILDTISGYTLVEYGMALSEHNPYPDIINDFKGVSEINKKDDNGNYGIRFIGKGLKIETDYYVRPYAIYEKNEIKTIIYGTVGSFRCSQLKSILDLNQLTKDNIVVYEL